ncbi:MAG TPA: bifunctional phosphoribosylaminoimidazolecarboxamide formyltransferase/IMP cyclohydrolase [bacterium]
MATVRRALLSCADKTGLEELARALDALGVELIASGGTARALTDAKLRMVTVEEFTGVREQLDGRVKTLHPKIHGGILARRDDPAHMEAVGAGGTIDLVCVNLYPFEDTVGRPGTTLADAVEQIDIGGVALLRAAAKNFQHVAVLSRPEQYPRVIESLRAGGGALEEPFLRELAVEAFELTSAYDRCIGDYLGAASAPASYAEEAFPERLTAEILRKQALRYGENPHQQGAWYVPAGGDGWGLATLTQLQGKELSYNNLIDVEAAFRCLLEFQEPVSVIVKHTCPCGLAAGKTMDEAYVRAFECDPESAFGGIVGFNRPLDAAAARKLTETFLEVVLAPSVEPDAMELLAAKKNLRVVTLEWPAAIPAHPQWREASGAWLLQEPDMPGREEPEPKVATARAPTDPERRDLAFAWKVAKHAKSNAIVVARDRATVAIGQGQPSRVGSVRVAIERAGSRAKGAVCASDAFFPFADGVELLAGAGIRAVIQPGGSVRDQEVVAAADAASVAMLLTGVRHFKH